MRVSASGCGERLGRFKLWSERAFACALSFLVVVMFSTQTQVFLPALVLLFHRQLGLVDDDKRLEAPQSEG